MLADWIKRDQLTHLKIKLRGDDPAWDYQRIVNVDRIASVEMRDEPTYSLDFNERCASGVVLAELLTRLQREAPVAFRRIAYTEQPTARELIISSANNVSAAAKLKPVVIDESLTDYDAYRRARALGYSGVALKACKGIGSSLLMAAACRKDGLFLCVQDLTCPGLALLASASLAAWLGSEGLEANARNSARKPTQTGRAVVPKSSPCGRAEFAPAGSLPMVSDLMASHSPVRSRKSDRKPDWWMCCKVGDAGVDERPDLAAGAR